MKFINPSEISGKILTLIEESDEKVIIVSPYMYISSWTRLKNRLLDLQKRGVALEIYVRDESTNWRTYSDLDSLGLKYSKIPNLHAKIYLNEKSGIATSLNLLHSSEKKSIEIGFQSESYEDYEKLMGFYRRYIVGGQNSAAVEKKQEQDVKPEIISIIGEKTPALKESILWFDGDVLKLNYASMDFSLSILKRKIKIACSLPAGTGNGIISDGIIGDGITSSGIIVDGITSDGITGNGITSDGVTGDVMKFLDNNLSVNFERVTVNESGEISALANSTLRSDSFFGLDMDNAEYIADLLDDFIEMMKEFGLIK